MYGIFLEQFYIKRKIITLLIIIQYILECGDGHHGQIADLDNVQCRLNSQYGLSNLVPIMQVHRNQFVCPYQAHCFALCMCCDFFACDCRMQCPEGCSCFHDSTWSANVIQCSKRGHTDIPALIPMDATSILLDGNNFTGKNIVKNSTK